MESDKEKLSRLEMMADGDSDWDLSDNDIAAIKWILDWRKAAAAILRRVAGGADCQHDAETLGDLRL